MSGTEVDAAKKWTRMRRWDAMGDPLLGFESKFLIDGLAIWRLQAGDAAAPSRADMSARVLKSFIGHVTIFERTADHRWLVRLMGTRMTSVIGEMQGKFVDEVLPRKAGRRWHVALDAALSGMHPLRLVSRVAFRDLDFLKAEILLAPLLDDTGRPTMVFAVVAFRAGVGLD